MSTVYKDAKSYDEIENIAREFIQGKIDYYDDRIVWRKRASWIIRGKTRVLRAL